MRNVMLYCVPVYSGPRSLVSTLKIH